MFKKIFFIICSMFIFYFFSLIQRVKPDYIVYEVYNNEAGDNLKNFKPDSSFFEVPRNQFFYLSNNKTNFENRFGSCGFTAIGMMLNYYDTFYDGNLIPDDFQTKGKKSNDKIYYIPGLKYVKASSAQEFYEKNKENNLLASLFDLYYTGSDKNISDGPKFGMFGLTLSKIYDIFNDYISTASQDRMVVKKIEDNYTANIEEKISSGTPVLVAGISKNGEAHVFVAYGSYNNKILCNMGWGEYNTSSNGLDYYYNINGAYYIDFRKNYHFCSKMFYDSKCICHSTMNPKYEMTPYDYKYHKCHCECEEFLEKHDFYVDGLYYICRKCQFKYMNNKPIIF